jgi:hypothetical protein
VRGWQHAGSLAAIFAGPGPNQLERGLTRPDVIFAAGIGKKRLKGADGRTVTVGSHSRRPLQTITAMADRLGLMPVTTHTKGEEAGLVEDLLGRNGSVLVCWQHEDIPAIGNRIIGNGTTVPQAWPEDRYDLIWVFDRTAKGWRFTELSQAPQAQPITLLALVSVVGLVEHLEGYVLRPVPRPALCGVECSDRPEMKFRMTVSRTASAARVSR